MPFYDKPLKENSPEYNAGIVETKQARENGSLDILEFEYDLKFKKAESICNYFEGPQYLDEANKHGGVYAVLQESMKRNIYWPYLLGYDTTKKYPDLPPEMLEHARRLLKHLKSKKNAPPDIQNQ